MKLPTTVARASIGRLDARRGLARCADTATQQRLDISVVTLLWRNERYARDFIGSLQVATAVASVPVELIVIVNGPEGAPARDALREHHTSPLVSLRIEELPENIGFAGGVNTGCALARGNALVVANLDLEFDAKFIVELVEIGPTFDALAFVAPSVTTPEPLGGTAVTAASLDGLVARDRLHRLQRYAGSTADGVRVPAGNGSCLVFGRPLLDRRTDDVGGLFDPEYHSYYEDVDLFWWADNHDIPTWFDPALRVVHHQGGSFDGKYRFHDRPAPLRASIMANYRINVWKNASLLAAVGWVAGEAGYVALSLRADRWRGLASYANSWKLSASRVRSIRRRRGRLRERNTTAR